MTLLAEVGARRRLYRSDFSDAFVSRAAFARTVSASVYVLFTSIGPAMTFAVFLQRATGGEYGANEVLLSTGVCGALYALLAGQPLVIVGVTGPVSIFSETVYAVVQQWLSSGASTDSGSSGANTDSGSSGASADSASAGFLPFMFWVCAWSALFHAGIGALGWCDWVRHVTRFSYEQFGALIGILYLYQALIGILHSFRTTTITTDTNSAGCVGLLTMLLAIGTLFFGSAFTAMRKGVVFNRLFRSILSDYAVPLTVVLMAALYQLPALRSTPVPMLQLTNDFRPTNGRASWIVDPLDPSLPSYAIALAIVPGLILTLLFFFDHNVSSILAQEARFNLKKPSAYNWDFVIIGGSIFITGLLGLPPANGLIPQAPLHVRSLAFVKEETIADPHNPHILVKKDTYVSVVEQRVSNILQSTLTAIIIIAPPFRFLLSSIPSPVLIGLFLFMGLESFNGNQFTERLFILLFVTERKHRMSVAPHLWPRIRSMKWTIWWAYTIIQVVCTAVIFGVTFTQAAISFPIFIVLLVPIRLYLLPRFFSAADLEGLDGDDSDEPVNDETGTVTGDVVPVSNDNDASNYVVEIELDRMHEQVLVEVVDKQDLS